MIQINEIFMNLYFEQIDLKCTWVIVETGFNMCLLEKSITQKVIKVIVPANFSNTPVFETSGQNISLACMPGTTLIRILLNS